MAEPTEVIQHQMEETRTRLAENVEKLTASAAETVGEVASSVSETVENVQETAQAVTETVQTVSQTVQEAVVGLKEGVKDVFDIPAHVRHHPLLMMGGSIAVGFVAGQMFLPRESGTPPASTPPRKTGNGVHHHRERASSRLQEHWPQQQKAEKAWTANLSEALSPALEKLKGLAIGAALGLARDAMTRSLPNELSDKVREILDDVTQRLGGKPMPVSEDAREKDLSRCDEDPDTQRATNSLNR